ncbi:hypothetical protein J2T58_001156 [Methanocalculus alkaliphilus]|nr:hypothetical protein [Methanocalculus alkaliphilus]
MGTIHRRICTCIPYGVLRITSTMMETPRFRCRLFHKFNMGIQGIKSIPTWIGTGNQPYSGCHIHCSNNCSLCNMWSDNWIQTKRRPYFHQLKHSADVWDGRIQSAFSIPGSPENWRSSVYSDKRPAILKRRDNYLFLYLMATTYIYRAIVKKEY